MAKLVSTGIQIPLNSDGAFFCTGYIETSIVIRPWIKNCELPSNRKTIEEILLQQLLKKRFQECSAVVVDVSDFSWGGKEHSDFHKIASTATIRADGRFEYPVSAMVTLLCTTKDSHGPSLRVEGHVPSEGLSRNSNVRVYFDKTHSFQMFVDKQAFSELTADESAKKRCYAEFDCSLSTFRALCAATRFPSSEKTYAAVCAHCQSEIPISKPTTVTGAEKTLCTSLNKPHPAFITAADVQSGKVVRWKRAKGNGPSVLTLEYDMRERPRAKIKAEGKQ